MQGLRSASGSVGPAQFIKQGVMKMTMKRGDIYYANLSPTTGAEQGGTCPVLILRQNTTSLVTVAAIQSPARIDKSTHVTLRHSASGLFRDSVVALDQLRSIDGLRLKEYMGSLDSATMERVERSLAANLGLSSFTD